MSDSAGTLLIVVADPVRAIDFLEYAAGLGVSVLGPVATEAQVRSALAKRAPDAALVDCTQVSPCEPIMDLLTDAGVPFIVVQDANTLRRTPEPVPPPAADIRLDDVSRDLVVVNLSDDPQSRTRLQSLLGSRKRGQ